MVIKRRQRGVTMVEFALVAPVVLLLTFVIVDFGRIMQANTTVAEAARQGARQAAANADNAANGAPDPWGAPDGNPCSGTAFTTAATGTGCLTDARIHDTVLSQLQAGGLTSTLPTATNVDAATCLSTFPSSGQAKVCIYPAASGSPLSADVSCVSAKSRLSHDPAPGDLGGRQTEYNSTNPSDDSKTLFKGCFLIQVTVIYTYKPYTGLVQEVIGNTFHISSSTSTIAEY